MKTKKKDPILKREETLLNRLRLKSAKKNLDRKTDKYGSLSEAAEKGEKAVKKVIKADDRYRKITRIAGPDSKPQRSRSKSYKPGKPPRPTADGRVKGKFRPGKATFEEKPKRGAKIKSFLQKCTGNTCAQKQKRAGGSDAFK